ncbi:hypothetical protein [Cryobacterium sp. GrIS_2_6]|uniref:hypothetical protein n=1 Tax=Cryobacterium sp. GrIS_2_6 TaxID=3162785 RepID=UPI002E00EE6D|nr:hypothetical protein [Cryobacterium psychrotolerans]
MVPSRRAAGRRPSPTSSTPSTGIEPAAIVALSGSSPAMASATEIAPVATVPTRPRDSPWETDRVIAFTGASVVVVDETPSPRTSSTELARKAFEGTGSSSGRSAAAVAGAGFLAPVAATASSGSGKGVTDGPIITSPTAVCNLDYISRQIPENVE